jgi:hypothetical protein
MSQRRPLYLEASQLIASHWSGGTLHEESRFTPDDAGIDAFAHYVAKHRRGSNFYLMADIAEEGFLIESLPYTQGADRQALLSRKLGQYFFGSPLATAVSYGREKTGRRDERFLFTALTRPQLFDPWLAALRAAEAQLAGVYSLPLLGNALLAKLSAPQARCLLVSITQAGIRQSYFENGQIKFSRLTPMAATGAREIAAGCAAEAEKIYQYLLGQRLLSRGTPLPVIALVHPAQMGAFIEQCKNTEDLQVDIRDLHAACKACGLKTLPPDSRSEALFLHLMAQSPPRDQFAPPEERRFFRLWRIRSGLLKAGAAALFSCLLYVGHQMVQTFDLSSATAVLKQDTENDQQKYAAIQKTFPPMPASTDSLRAVINRFEELEKRSVTPAPLYLAISRALGATPRVDLERIQWQLGSNPDEGLQLPPDRRGTVPAPSPADKAGGAMYATAVIHGLLPASMAADQRSQLDTVNAFAQALQQDAALSVAIRRMPFDIESGKSLKSTEESEKAATQPKFIVQVSRKL